MAKEYKICATFFKTRPCLVKRFGIEEKEVSRYETVIRRKNFVNAVKTARRLCPTIIAKAKNFDICRIWLQHDSVYPVQHLKLDKKGRILEDIESFEP